MKSNENQTKELRNVERKKSKVLLIISLILLLGGIILSVYAYQTSYANSKITADKLTTIKAEISSIELGETTGDLDSLKVQQAALADIKLSQEKPYSYGLSLLFIGIILFVKGLFNAIIGVSTSQKTDLKKLVQAGLLAALCYIGFAVFKIDIPVGPEKTAFHFGNVFCVLAALLLGGYWGGLAGAVGMTIADLTTAYVTSAPKTFLLKLCIGLIVGLVAHKIFKLSHTHSKKYITIVTIVASISGMAFNVVADPLIGYFYKMYLLGLPQDISVALAKMSALTTSVNAVVAVIAASTFYFALRPALIKSGLFVQVTPLKIKDNVIAEDES